MIININEIEDIYDETFLVPLNPTGGFGKKQLIKMRREVKDYDFVIFQAYQDYAATPVDLIVRIDEIDKFINVTGQLQNRTDLMNIFINNKKSVTQYTIQAFNFNTGDNPNHNGGGSSINLYTQNDLTFCTVNYNLIVNIRFIKLKKQIKEQNKL